MLPCSVSAGTQIAFPNDMMMLVRHDGSYDHCVATRTFKFHKVTFTQSCFFFFLIILFISYASHFAFEYILDFHIHLYFVLFFTTRAMSLATPNDSPEFQKFPEEKQKYTHLIKLEVAYNH